LAINSSQGAGYIGGRLQQCRGRPHGLHEAVDLLNERNRKQRPIRDKHRRDHFMTPRAPRRRHSLSKGPARWSQSIALIVSASATVTACGSPHRGVSSLVNASSLSRPQPTQISAEPTVTSQSPAPAPVATQQSKPSPPPQRCAKVTSYTIGDGAAPTNLPLHPRPPMTVCLHLTSVFSLYLGRPAGGGTWPDPVTHGVALQQTGITRAGGHVVASFTARRTGSAAIEDAIGFAPGPSTAFTIYFVVNQ